MEDDDRITRQFKLYAEQRLKAEAAKAESVKQHKILAAIEYRMVELMLETKTKHKKFLEDSDLKDVTVGLRRRRSFSNTEDNREQVRQWLLDTTGDDQPFVEEVVSRKALDEHVKKLVESGKIASDFPDFLNVNLHPSVSVLGWKQWKARKLESEK